jgi:hypothetical protein
MRTDLGASGRSMTMESTMPCDADRSYWEGPKGFARASPNYIRMQSLGEPTTLMMRIPHADSAALTNRGHLVCSARMRLSKV